MSVLLYIASIWFALSILTTAIFIWALKTGRISFAPRVDDELAQFHHDWKQS